MPTYNPIPLTSFSKGPASSPLSSKGKRRTAVRVVDVILTPDSPYYSDSNDIGAIKYRPLTSTVNEESPENLPIAWPLEGTFRKYPLKNEIVFLETAPGPDEQIGSKTYYSQLINIWNNPHHNAFPDLEIYDGELNLGDNFIEERYILPKTPKDGDVIIEGRRGQSIRFTGNGTNTIITSGQSASTTTDVTVNENINSDPASIYMVTGRVPLSAASSNYDSYTDYIPSTPSSYQGNQIVLSSDRLVFNSRTDHIMLSSNLTVGFNAIRGFNFDTPTNFIVDAGTSIRFGSATADHPLLKGDDTVKVLEELIDTLINLMEGLVQGASQPIGPMPTIIEQGSATTFVLANLKTRLEGLKSTKTYTD